MKYSVMKKEIQQQPEILISLWKEEHQNIVDVAGALSSANRVILTGAGDSLAAAICGHYFFLPSGIGRVFHVDPMYLSTYLAPFLVANDYIIAISTSGRTPRVIEAVKRAKERQTQIIGVTDDPESPLAKISDHHISIRSSDRWHVQEKLVTTSAWIGYDHSVPQTKTFLATIHALYMLGSETLRNFALQQANQVAIPMVKDLVSDEYFQQVFKVIKKWKKLSHVYFTGNGSTMGVSYYGANKFLEYAQKSTAATIEDFCHTHFWSLNKYDVVVFLPSSDRDVDRIQEVLPVLNELKVKTVMIYGEDSGTEGVDFLPLPAFLDPRVMPMISTVPVQILAYWFGMLYRPNPNEFRGGKDFKRWNALAKRLIRGSRIRE